MASAAASASNRGSTGGWGAFGAEEGSVISFGIGPHFCCFWRVVPAAATSESVMPMRWRALSEMATTAALSPRFSAASMRVWRSRIRCSSCLVSASLIDSMR